MCNNSVFSYFITENKNAGALSFSELSVKRKFGEYIILTDSNTPFASAIEGKTECAVFGLTADVVSGQSNNIAEKIVKNCKNIHDVIEYEKNLGGKYILLYKQGEAYYIQGDATCSIPIFYTTEGSFVCSSNAQYIVNVKKYCVDDEYGKIRRCGNISQAMPYDITPYRQIKQLLPNHYLDISKQESVRFINSVYKQKEISVAQATERVLPMIEKLLALYIQHYKIYCPITSGRDSRVVLSFLRGSNTAFSCYTIKHPEHSDKTQDITVPIELCEKLGMKHQLVQEVAVPEVLKNEMDILLGEESYSLRTLRIALTIKEYFGDGAIINGDIIGQVGKCSLHRDIPRCFATPEYFRCKLHNYSNGAKKQLKLWLDEIQQSGEQINTFDLFSVESRMGRWASQENLIYNTVGQVYLNMFNSRSIIYIWTAVSRKLRKNVLLHKGLIDKKASALLDIPFGQSKSIFKRLSKSNGLLYLLSSYLKYYIEKQLFFRRKNYEKTDHNG